MSSCASTSRSATTSKSSWSAAIATVARDPHDAEDVAQQPFPRTFDRLETFEPRAGIPSLAWLFRVSRNESLTHLRKQGRVEVEDPEELARRIADSAVERELMDEVIG